MILLSHKTQMTSSNLTGCAFCGRGKKSFSFHFKAFSCGTFVTRFSRLVKRPELCRALESKSTFQECLFLSESDSIDVRAQNVRLKELVRLSVEVMDYYNTHGTVHRNDECRSGWRGDIQRYTACTCGLNEWLDKEALISGDYQSLTKDR